jgi:hypothetical protein
LKHETEITIFGLWLSTVSQPEELIE